MTEQIGSRPQPIEQSVQPIDSDLSHNLRAKADRRRLSGAAGIAAGAVLATSLGAAAESDQSNDTSPSSEPTPIVSFMEVADTNQDGQLDLGEVLIGIPKYAEIVANQAEDLKAQEELSEFKPTAKLLNEVVNQKDKTIKKVKVSQIKKKSNKLLELHGDELATIKTFDEEPLSKKYLNIYYEELVNGSALSKNAREEQKQLERSLAAGGLMSIFLDIYDKTDNPDIKRRAAEALDMTFDHTATVIYDEPTKGLRRNLKDNIEITLGLNN